MATAASSGANSRNNAFKACRTESSTIATDKLILLSQDKEKPMAVRNANIMAARGISMPALSGTLLNLGSCCRCHKNGRLGDR